MALFLVTNNLTRRGRARPEPRAGVSRVGRRSDGRPHGPAAGRLSAGGAEAHPARPKAADRTGPAPACRRPISRPRPTNCEASSAASRPRRTCSRTCSIPKVFADFVAHQREVFRHRACCRRRVLLRPGAGRGSRRRDRAGQDADRQVPDRRRSASRRPAHGVLRAQRPAAQHQRARPSLEPDEKHRAKADRGRPAASRRPDARPGRHRGRASRATRCRRARSC